MLLIRHSPYGSSLARASLDLALAAAVFDLPVSLLFTGDGVLQLIPEQDSKANGSKNLGRLISSLPLYGIEQVYVDAEAAARYGLDLDAAPVSALALNVDDMSQLVRSHDQLLGL